MIENDLGVRLSLDGEWAFQLADQLECMIQVPGAWEAQVADRLTDGPARYRRHFSLAQKSHLIVLHCEAIAFAATIWVNGHHVGEHTGMWAPFQLDITAYAQLGDNDILIEVWKPGTKYPLRETLAGFLPDVANTFGGIWQHIELRLLDAPAFDTVRLVAQHHRVVISGSIADATAADTTGFSIWVAIYDDADILLSTTQDSVIHNEFYLEVNIDDTIAWTPSAPKCYRCVCQLMADAAQGQAVAQVTRTFGFRDITAQGEHIVLGGRPQHIRGVLSWGWDAQTYCPTPTAEQVRANFAAARALGFNTVKLCLFVPDETLFDIADEEGMLLWLELPLWQPNMTTALRELIVREYEGVLRKLHQHPSIVIVSLGCELDQQTDAGLLGVLRAIVHTWMPNVLRCDNSGSSEAYGGDLNSGGDFYDYHFYCEPHYFQELIDHFRRRYQPQKPWIFGEFCDADTLRDFSQLIEKPVWWVDGPVTFERNELFWLQDYRVRLAHAGVYDGAHLTRIARLQAQDVRKFILERVRLNFAGGGYVVTGWQDTPIATSGMVDDQGELKFDAATWRTFNGDVVVVLDRARRRHWVHGGDRPRYQDNGVFWSDETVDLRLIVVNGGDVTGNAHLTYSVGGQVVDSVDITLNGSGVIVVPVEIALFVGVNNLGVKLYLNKYCLCEASWKILCIAAGLRDNALVLAPLVQQQITSDMLASIGIGAAALVWLREALPYITQPLPFWRESIHVFQPHPFWDGISQDGFADLRFYSVATDFAIDLIKLRHWLIRDCLCEESTLELIPIWRRFDARAMVWHEYVVEVRYGQGRLFVSTLRFAGGLGQQSTTLADNPMGCLLLSRLHDLVMAHSAEASTDPV